MLQVVSGENKRFYQIYIGKKELKLIKYLKKFASPAIRSLLRIMSPVCVLLTPEIHQEMLDMIDDRYMMTIAEERIKDDNRATRSFEEVLAKDGLTLADVEAMEDVKIE